MPNKKINLVAADMGYGHQRAAYPLLGLSGGEIITINDYPGIPAWEKEYWVKNLKGYEIISRFKKIPLFGAAIFSVMDYFQRIEPFYPRRDLSRQSWQQKIFLRALKKGLGRDLIEKLNPSGLPLVTSFFVAAYAAEYFSYQGDIYCIICDSDVSRAWAPLWPEKSRTKFFVPNERVRDRLQMYGVKKENIILTGFPLPKENIGAERELLKSDLAARLKRLDPLSKEAEYHKNFLAENKPGVDTFSPEAPTITFAVGGAGAQKEIGAIILNKLSPLLKNGSLRLNLVAGSRAEVKDFFAAEIKKNSLESSATVKIIFASTKLEYFKKFNECLRQSDVLWTKPSELSFYCGLGLPIIISSPLGSQEDFNHDWLLSLGAGIDSLKPELVAEWWPDLISSGRLARAAYDAFLGAENLGTYKIEQFFS